MTTTEEQTYRAIGRELVACAPDGVRPVLVYAEADQHSRSAEVFYPAPGAKGLVYKFGSSELKDAVSALWSLQEKKKPTERWRALCFMVEGNAFKLDLVYLDQFDETVGQSDRRQRFLDARFGKLAKKVDYSAPDLGTEA